MLVLAVVDYLAVSTLVVLGLCKAASINPAESEGCPESSEESLIDLTNRVYDRHVSGKRVALALSLVALSLTGTASAQSFKGTCAGSISESDGVNHSPNGMNAKSFFALMKQARESHLKLGSDGFLWSTRLLNCDSVAIVDDKGHTAVTFSDGVMFAGGRVNGDGPLFFSDAVNLGSGPDIHLNPNQQGCHFYFTDHGTFTQGWESRLATIECELRMKTGAGHLISATVSFTVAATP